MNIQARDNCPAWITPASTMQRRITRRSITRRLTIEGSIIEGSMTEAWLSKIGTVQLWLALCGLLGLALGSPGVRAEPYIAVESGLKCASCHVNPSGGGKRTAFGTLYARSQLASRMITRSDESQPWTGEVTDWFSLGGNLRFDYEDVDVPGFGGQSDTGISRATVYLRVEAVQNLLTLYVDEHVAPDDTFEREAYAMLTPANGKYTIKLGQFFLPFGLRLQDDSAFVRQTSGINFNTPDDGIEVGLELARWSAQLAVSDGSAGGSGGGSNDQLSLSASYVLPRWRVGASVNMKDDPLGDREMIGLFAGFRTGPISWLTELDFITDQTPAGDQDLYASLLEGNWRIRKGQNLKGTYEFFDPVGRSNERERYSLVWEYSPMQLIQSRVGIRKYNGVPDIAVTNRGEFFAELHFYF